MTAERTIQAGVVIADLMIEFIFGVLRGMAFAALVYAVVWALHRIWRRFNEHKTDQKHIELGGRSGGWRDGSGER